jgi:hypothetical protein
MDAGHFYFGDLAFKDKQFETYYKTEISPIIEEMEKDRIRLKEKRNFIFFMLISSLIFIFATLILLLFQYLTYNQKTIYIIIFLFFTISFSVYFIFNKINIYRKNEYIISKKIFSFFSENIAIENTRSNSIKNIKAKDICPEYKIEEIRNYSKIKYDNIDVEFIGYKLFDGEFGKIHNLLLLTKGITRAIIKLILILIFNRRYYTYIGNVYIGFFVIISMNKNFKGKTIVKENKLFKNMSFYIERVHLEDPEFESKFDVYSTDQVEARYLLTTTFMERLLKIDAIHHQGIQCIFQDNHLLIMVPTKEEWFSINTFEKGNFQEEIKDLFHKITAIFEIVDILKLQQKTGL